MSTFNGSHCREDPAGAAMTLVLDGVDGVLGPPVDFSWDINGSLISPADSGLVDTSLKALESKEPLLLSGGPG